MDSSSHPQLNHGEDQPRPVLKVDDELILRLLRRGDFRAIDLLAKNYGGRILGFVEQILQDRSASGSASRSTSTSARTGCGPEISCCSTATESRRR